MAIILTIDSPDDVVTLIGGIAKAFNVDSNVPKKPWLTMAEAERYEKYGKRHEIERLVSKYGVSQKYKSEKKGRLFNTLDLEKALFADTFSSKIIAEKGR